MAVLGLLLLVVFAAPFILLALLVCGLIYVSLHDPSSPEGADHPVVAAKPWYVLLVFVLVIGASLYRYHQSSETVVAILVSGTCLFLLVLSRDYLAHIKKSASSTTAPGALRKTTYWDRMRALSDAPSPLLYATMLGILSVFMFSQVYFCPPNRSTARHVSPAQDPKPAADLKSMCEKENNCTYQVAGPQPGTMSTVYEIEGLRFTIPDPYFAGRRFSPMRASSGDHIVVWLPDMKPLTQEERNSNTLSETPKYRQQLSIWFHKNNKQPHPVNIQQLEDEIVSRRHEPRPVPGIASLQEYASVGKQSYFRAKASNIRYYDGLPTYFVCHGDPVVLGYDPVANSKKASCLMSMTWPNGFEVDISFDESLLPQWNTVLGTAVGFLRSFEDQHRLPGGTLALD